MVYQYDTIWYNTSSSLPLPEENWNSAQWQKIGNTTATLGSCLMLLLLATTTSPLKTMRHMSLSIISNFQVLSIILVSYQPSLVITYMGLYVFCLQSLIASNQMGRAWEWCAFGEGRVERRATKALLFFNADCCMKIERHWCWRVWLV